MDIGKVGQLGSQVGMAEEPADKKAGALPASSDRDGCGVSEAARTLRAELSAPDPSRAGRVARLKALVAEGLYQPDEMETARRFLGR